MSVANQHRLLPATRTCNRNNDVPARSSISMKNKDRVLSSAVVLSIFALILLFWGSVYVLILTYEVNLALFLLALGVVASILLMHFCCCRSCCGQGGGKRYFIAMGVFMILTSIACMAVGLDVFLYPYEEYCYYCRERERGLLGLLLIRRRRRRRSLEHTTSSWKPYGIVLIVDSLLWLVSGALMLQFALKRYDKLVSANGGGEGGGGGGGEANNNATEDTGGTGSSAPPQQTSSVVDEANDNLGTTKTSNTTKDPDEDPEKQPAGALDVENGNGSEVVIIAAA